MATMRCRSSLPTRVVAALAVAGLIALGACGGGGGSPSSSTPTPQPTPTPNPSPTPTPAPTPTPTPSASPTSATVTITSAGVVNPKTVTITVGGRVAFVNSSSRFHEMASDPHPVHTDCPPINNVGALAPGQTGQTGAFNSPRTCAYHDHGEPENGSLQGTIVIQ